MKRPRARASRSEPEPPPIEPLVAMLEFTATERPEHLPWLFSQAKHGPARLSLHRLAAEWEIQAPELERVARKAAADLDRLEARRIDWTAPDALRDPNLRALIYFATERRDRVRTARRRQRLEIIRRRLGSCLETALRRQRIERFLGIGPREKPAPAEPHWVEELLAE